MLIGGPTRCDSCGGSYNRNVHSQCPCHTTKMENACREISTPASKKPLKIRLVIEIEFNDVDILGEPVEAPEDNGMDLGVMVTEFLMTNTNVNIGDEFKKVELMSSEVL